MKISRKSLDFIQQFTYIAQEVRTRIVGLLASFPSQEYEQRFCIVYIPRLCSRLMQGVYKIQEPLPLLTFSRSCFSQQLFKNIRKKGGNVTGLSLKLIWRFIFEVKRVLMSDVSNCFEKFWKFLIYSNHVFKKISLQHRDYVISIIRVCKNSREQWKAVYVNCICTNEILVALNYLNYRQPLLQLCKCVYNMNENIFSCLWY